MCVLPSLLFVFYATVLVNSVALTMVVIKSVTLCTQPLRFGFKAEMDI